MRCPVCRSDNYEGEDLCANCGADLRATDVPQQAPEFGDTVLGDPLAALGAGSPRTMGPATPVAEAIRVMHAEGVDCLLVCDGDRLLGIFTDRDAVLKVAGRSLAAIVVGDVMTPDPVVLRRDDTLATAIHKMAVGGFRHLPIVDGDRPVGLVSAADVFRHLVAATA